jgi:hypothetical protein
MIYIDISENTKLLISKRWVSYRYVQVYAAFG